jgi:hypothetical protein
LENVLYGAFCELKVDGGISELFKDIFEEDRVERGRFFE